MDFTMDDAIAMLGGSWGRLQTLAIICNMIIFAVGSQFFYSMPFYTLYPKLHCYDYDKNLMF